MYIERKIEKAICKGLREYPVVTVTGPRQSGKTTLVRHLAKGKSYFTLETPSVRMRAAQDPEGFLADCSGGAIIDEVQRVPSLLSYIQGIVDGRRENGLFILTGSSNMLLLDGVSQSLAGRTALYRLLPLSVAEMFAAGAGCVDIDEAILSGGYPRLAAEKPDREFFFQNYIDTYVERDVRTILNIRNEMSFMRFVKLCAGRIGSLLDWSNLSNDVGCDVKTLREWMSVLEASYVAFLLEPWHENRGKRLVKSPKIYFYDTGLACALLGIANREQLGRDPMRGHLFENLVILERMKATSNAGRKGEFYFYRDGRGNEVDLLEMRGGEAHPTEIKSAMTFTPSFCKGLEAFAKFRGDASVRGEVVYAGGESHSWKGIDVIGFGDMVD